MRKGWLAAGLLMFGLQSGQAGLIINVAFNDPGNLYTAYYDNLTTTAQATGLRWGNFLVGDASLEVLIDFANLGPTATGRSQTSFFVGTEGGFNIFEQAAAAELRTGIDPNGVAADIEFSLNPLYLTDELFFDPDPFTRLSIVPGDKTDAYSVLLHEFGHAFVFNGWTHIFNGTLPGDYKSTFDRWVSFDGSDFFFNGPNAVAIYGAPVPLSYGNIFHLGNGSPRPGEDLIPDLMNGVVFIRGNQYNISALDIAIMQDSGLNTVPEPASWMLAFLGITALLLRRIPTFSRR